MNRHELLLGTRIEMEHTSSPQQAARIAMEHLREHPDYYSRLKAAGLGKTDFSKALVSGVVGTVGKRDPNVPAPMDLYNEAAPRIIRGLKQYDAAAPLIDWLTANWYIAVGVAALIAIGGSYVGNVIYHKAHRRA